MTKSKKTAKKKAPAKVKAKKALSKKSIVRKTKAAVRKTKAAQKPSPKTVRTQKTVHGFSEQLRDAALKVLDDRQADEIVTVNLTGKSSMADYLLIASGRAARQIAAIAHHLREAFEKLGIKQIRVEGLPEANWVLVDAGDIVVHLFRPEVRRYYDLEAIWRPTAKR